MTCLWLVECVGGRREIVGRGLRECGVTTMRAALAILRPRRIATSKTSGQKPATSNVTRSTAAGHRAAVGLFEHGGLAYCAAARHEGVVCRLTSAANFAAFSFIRW